MYGPFRIEGLAIASVDGNIADHTGLMPNSLKLDADQALFKAALDDSDVVIHGRMSHERQPNSYKRRRLVMTRRVSSLEVFEDNPIARLWNPAGASLEEACAAVGCSRGLLSILGGPDVYSHFLPLGYDKFVLCRAVKVVLPNGVPVFAEMREGRIASQVLEAAGLKLGESRRLDDQVNLDVWGPAGG